MGSRASTASTSRPLAARSATEAKSGLGPIGLALDPALLARVDQSHHLDVGIVDVGPHVEVVDAPEPDEGGPHRTVIGNKGHWSGVRLWN